MSTNNLETINLSMLTEMQLNCIITKCNTSLELKNLVLEARKLPAYAMKQRILNIQGK